MIVEKFGGSSMADPELVLQRIEEQQEMATVVVVSAPGTSAENPIKLTDLLLEYAKDRSALKKSAVLRRLGDFAARTYQDTSYFMEEAEQELEQYTQRQWPIESLGELWSARAFAMMSGFTFLDPKQLIFFDKNKQLNVKDSVIAFQKAVEQGEQYVLPGFYGSLPSGDVCVFERGGSDISGALAAVALGASCYRNWSDVPGFLLVDPRKIPGCDQKILNTLTYHEIEALNHFGSGLLHADVAKLLKSSGITTTMCDTFSGKSGTVINLEREWHESPVAGIAITSSENLFHAVHVIGKGLQLCQDTRNNILDICSSVFARHELDCTFAADHTASLSISFHISDIPRRRVYKIIQEIISRI